MKVFRIPRWYRVGASASLVWVVVMLISLDPWTAGAPSNRFGVPPGALENRWAEFFKLAILPVLIPWLLLWCVRGFKLENRPVSSDHISPQDAGPHSLQADTATPPGGFGPTIMPGTSAFKPSFVGPWLVVFLVIGAIVTILILVRR